MVVVVVVVDAAVAIQLLLQFALFWFSCVSAGEFSDRIDVTGPACLAQ